MKKSIIIESIILVLILVLFMIFNINIYKNASINIILILAFLLIIINKRRGFFIIFTFFISISSLMIYIQDNIPIIALLPYYLILIIYLYSGFKFIFNLNNNTMNISFKNLPFPENEEYLVVKYLSGPIKQNSAKGILIKKENCFLLNTEDLNGNICTINIKYDSITNIEIIEMPYFKSTESLTNYEPDLISSCASGRPSGNFEVFNSKKIIKSYNIKIFFNNQILHIMSFDYPYIFDNLIIDKK